MTAPLPPCTCGHAFSETGMFHLGDCPRKALPWIDGQTEAVDNLPELRWHYGPTDTDPNPGAMWHYGCGGEVMYFEGAPCCTRCKQWGPEGQP